MHLAFLRASLLTAKLVGHGFRAWRQRGFQARGSERTANLPVEMALKDSGAEKVALRTLPKLHVFALALVAARVGESGAILGFAWRRRRCEQQVSCQTRTRETEKEADRGVR